jgi:DNA-binding GntR family transcriptional regulator
MTMTPPVSRTVPGLQPVTSGTRRDEVADSIRRALLTGELRPGERIKESELATRLGVSRPTVREAVHVLLHEGTLVQQPYKEIRVAEASAQTLLDLAEVRVSLETTAALRLAGDPSGDGLRALEHALTEHAQAIEAGDLVASDLTHLHLHRTLWLASGSEMLGKIWPLVAAQIRVAMTVDRATRYDPDRDLAMHRHLVQVITAGEPNDIRAEVDRHIRDSAQEVVSITSDCTSLTPLP